MFENMFLAHKGGPRHIPPVGLSHEHQFTKPGDKPWDVINRTLLSSYLCDRLALDKRA